MIWLKRLGLVLFVTASFAVLWYEVHHSPALAKKRIFQQNLQSKLQENRRILRKQQHLRQKAIGLQYDARVIANEAREQLNFKRKGEVTLILKQRK